MKLYRRLLTVLLVFLWFSMNTLADDGSAVGVDQQHDAAGSAQGSDDIIMVKIPGKDYEISKFEVTQKQWRDITGENPSYFKSCGDNCPVEQVSWNDVQDFIQKLSQKTGKQYRLPTEAEWTYACYGGTRTTYCGSNDINAVAWYRNNSSNTTHPVGQKQPNGYGLYDMSGNVKEWVQDRPEHYVRDGRVARGGSWINIILRISVANNMDLSGYLSDMRFNILGFRLARTL